MGIFMIFQDSATWPIPCHRRLPVILKTLPNFPSVEGWLTWLPNPVCKETFNPILLWSIPVKESGGAILASAGAMIHSYYACNGIVDWSSKGIQMPHLESLLFRSVISLLLHVPLNVINWSKKTAVKSCTRLLQRGSSGISTSCELHETRKYRATPRDATTTTSLFIFCLHHLNGNDSIVRKQKFKPRINIRVSHGRRYGSSASILTNDHSDQSCLQLGEELSW